MPKKKNSRSKNQASSSGTVKSKKKTTKKVAKKKSTVSGGVITSSVKVQASTTDRFFKSLKVHRFLGVSLGGGKTNKTAVAVVDYYPVQSKLFLTKLYGPLEPAAERSADEALVEVLQNYQSKFEMTVINAPTTLPKCIGCKLKCPGTQLCKESEVAWIRTKYQAKNVKKKPKKHFTPYTERCAETYIANCLEEPFYPSHALGANAAPLLARSLFLQKHLDKPLVEFNAKVSLWRIGRSLSIQKSHLRFHKHAVSGHDCRLAILNKLIDKDVAFIYEQDAYKMVEDNTNFEAFLGALTGVLKFRNMTEQTPPGYPKNETWIEIPLQKITW